MAYFDNAATTYPKPECVYQDMDRIYRHAGGSAGRGLYLGSASIGKLLQETRDYLKELLHCPGKEAIFTPTATIALNMIIQGLLKKGLRTVYITPFEHNAVTRVLYPYKLQGNIRIRQLAFDEEEMSYDLAGIEADFQVHKPDLVIATHASNVIGLISPIEKIFSLAKKHKAFTVADMSQTAGLVDIIVDDTFDFAVFAGHKTLYGPTGISGFVMKPGIELVPILYGGTGYESANLAMPKQLPERFEMGTMNSLGIAGLHASLEWILETGIDNIWQQEQRHRERLLSILQNSYLLRLVGVNNNAEYVGIASCIMGGIDTENAGYLFTDRDIAVRSGLQCAPMAHEFMGTHPDGTVRFSTSYFTTDEDFRALEDALNEIEFDLI